MERNLNVGKSTSVEEEKYKTIELPMGHRSSKSAIINSSSSVDLNRNYNTNGTIQTTNTTVPTINEPSSTNRIPIPLSGSTTINVQIQESPSAVTSAASTSSANTSAAAIVASSNTQLSDSESSSLTSLSGNSLQNRQIIIKIQLAKMQNGSETAEISGSEALSGMTSPVAASADRNSIESITATNNSPQFVNLTLNGNLIYSEDASNESMSLPSTSNTAGGITTSANNNNNQKSNNTNSQHNDWDQQNTIEALPEYCEVMEEIQNETTYAANISNGSYLENKKVERSNSISTVSSDTIGCLNGRRKTKNSSRPTSASGLTLRCRDALRRMSSKSTNKSKDQNKRHSENSTMSPKSYPALSSPLPSTSGQAQTPHQSNNSLARLQSRISNQNTSSTTTTATTTASTATSWNTIMPISIATVGANGNSNNTVSTANQLPATIWTPSGNDLIIPISSPPQFVVVQCAPTSVVTVGRIDDNAIRLTSTEIGQNGVASNMNGLMKNCNSNVNNVGSGVAANASVKTMHNGPIVHSQIDFVHWLVPDLDKITNSSFYWGKIDRYEAERLLEGKPEGTFLLRDSAQEEYLFSVTFRKYGRSLHARIEQSGHKFGFDCHDPCVFTAPTVTGLLQHYKDPACVMFFEPMLTIPLHRKKTFSLQELARAAIVSNTYYDGINELGLPARLKSFLKEYHYKQKLRIKPLDDPFYSCT